MAYDALIAGDKNKYQEIYENFVAETTKEINENDSLSEYQKSEELGKVESTWHSGIKDLLKKNHSEELTEVATKLEAGNVAEYISLIKKYAAIGFDAEDVAGAVFALEDEEGKGILSGDPVSGSPYSYNNLYDAVGEGATYKTVYNSILEAKVKTKMEKYPDLSKAEATESVEEDIHKAIRERLKTEDDIQSQILDHEIGDFSSYENIIQKYISKGYDEDDVIQVVRADKTKIVGNTLYSCRDLFKVAGTSDQNRIFNKLVEAYRKEGMNAKEIKSEIRKSATTYFKDIYINGTPEDRARVKNKMVALGVYDSNNEIVRILRYWYDNYCK